ncbi:MAG TPA: ABC transporter permease [Vicinamibacterales bacterium]|nr:ABC transporter permease [Vicinamibacterales bacterium]
MPEFRRGWGRWLPRAAERELFHPSLEDLRAEGRRGVRLQIAIAALWLDCWKVWLFALNPPKGGHHTSRFRIRRVHMSMVMQDVRRALRLFRMEPGFTAAAVLTLALGIGGNTALFAVVEAVLLRPLPVSGADELVIVRHRDLNTGLTKDHLALGDVIDLRARIQTLEAFAPYGGTQTTLYGDGEPMRLEGLAATPELLAALRVQTSMGRLLTAEDGRQGAPRVVMISHELWQTRFGSDPNIVGRGVQLGGGRAQVVGVIERAFHFPPNSPTHVIFPFPQLIPPPQRKAGWIFGMGRMKPGVTVDAVRAELAALSAEFERQYPDQNRGTQYFAEGLRDALVGDTKGALLLLLAAVAFILLIACVNVGNLLLARSLARRQEMAVRTALGAGWSRLASQVVIEALVLALAGGLVGVVLAWQAAPALAAMVPETTRVPGLRDVGINVTVLLFTFGASIVAALVFGTLACLSIASREQRSALAATRGSTSAAGSRRAAAALVAAEIGLAAVLLLGAGLTLRSFSKLIAVDPGFRTANVLAVSVTVPAARYPKPPLRADFYSRAFAALEALPEVEHAGVGVVMPLTGNNWTSPFERVDRPVPPGERPPEVGWQSATGGYFSALGIPLLAGRLFEDRDVSSPVAPVIVSNEIARRFFANENPLGHRLKNGDSEVEIVGVVGDIRRGALTEQPRADLYFAFARFADTSATLYIHTTGDPIHALPAVQAALRGLEPNVLVYGARTMADVASASAAVATLAMRLLAGFALVALLLAAIGIYGVMAYSVRRRSREIGTRVALGATRGDIVRLIMREGGIITIVGIGAGLAIGLFASQSLVAILYDVPPTDAVSIGAAALLLSAAAMAACYVPARRAARIDPAKTLTAE